MNFIKEKYLKKSQRVLTKILIVFSLYACAQQQDSSINNLEYPDWYQPVPLGDYGDVTKIGTGNKQMILVAGLGFDGSIFYDFMMRNKDKYTMHAFTEAGIGTTIGPPIPKDQNYGDRIWSNAFESAVIEYIKENNLNNVTVLGFFSGGVQHAIHIADREPKRVKKLILVSGELYRAGAGSITAEVRAEQVKGMVEGWFKTVTKKTWYNGMFEPALFSKDSIQAQRYWEIPNIPKLPILIQSVAEFMAEDIREIVLKLKLPTLVVIPSFTKEYLSIDGNDFIKNTFVNEWDKFRDANKKDNIIYKKIEDSQIFVFYDQLTKFDDLVKTFIN